MSLCNVSSTSFGSTGETIIHHGNGESKTETLGRYTNRGGTQGNYNLRLGKGNVGKLGTGKINKYKARLNAHGVQQGYGSITGDHCTGSAQSDSS